MAFRKDKSDFVHGRPFRDKPPMIQILENHAEASGSLFVRGDVSTCFAPGPCFHLYDQNLRQSEVLTSYR